MAADLTDAPSFSPHDYGQPGTRLNDRNRPAPSRLEDLYFLVCKFHKKGDAPVLYDNDTLYFSSYRHYREFLRLNHIDGVVGSRT